MTGCRPSPTLGTAELGELVSAVRAMPAAQNDAERIDRIRQFEQLKSAISAAQLAEAAAFDSSQRVDNAKAGIPPSRQGRGIAGQVALAMHVSPWYAQRWLGWAKVLTRELPITFEQLRAGRTNQNRALIMARETVFLSREGRAEVDALLGPDLERLSDARIEGEAKKHAYRLDPAGVVARRRVAIGERCVTLRPRPDTMSTLSGTGSIERGVAMIAALTRAADTAVASGDAEGRSRNQIMFDTLFERVTGVAHAEGVPVSVDVVIPVDSLVGCDDTDESAVIVADGLVPTPLPATVTRELVASAPKGWMRRLFTAPGTGRLVAMETTARCFTAPQSDFLRRRDQYCSTPYCGAPIRHADHAVPSEDGGATSVANGNGKCAACNWAKQALGWRQTMTADGHGTITTPTGHTYDLAPPALGAPTLVRTELSETRPPPPNYSPVIDFFWPAYDRAS